MAPVGAERKKDARLISSRDARVPSDIRYLEEERSVSPQAIVALVGRKE